MFLQFLEAKWMGLLKPLETVRLNCKAQRLQKLFFVTGPAAFSKIDKISEIFLQK